MKSLSIVLLGGAILMCGGVAAKDYPHVKQPANADQYYDIYTSPSQALAPSKTNGAVFDQWGALRPGGPFHPEGPGNVSD
jgi:hypothetical protein